MEFNNVLYSAPVHTLPNFERPFVEETNASAFALGSVLAQEKEGHEAHPIEYASRTMTEPGFKHSACEKEAFSVVFCTVQVSSLSSVL